MTLELMRNMAEDVNEVKERIEIRKRTQLFVGRLSYSDVILCDRFVTSLIIEKATANQHRGTSVR
jgi:hypothetical protein